MRIIGISPIRDEEDIIESFVRHNLAYLDKLYIIDNLSKDKTLDILAALKQEGLAIEVWESKSCSNQQSRAMTTALRKLAQHDPDAEFAFLLDADEFLGCVDRQALVADLGKIGADGYGVMPWRTYIPIEHDLENLNPAMPVTSRMTHRRSHEGHQRYKAVVPKALFGKARVRQGSHSLLSMDGAALPKSVLATPLAHFPVRSANQFLAKIILSSHSSEMKKERRPDESIHWVEMAASIRSRNYRVTADQVREYAFSYAIKSVDSAPVNLLHDPLPMHSSTIVKYGAAEERSVLHRFDQYITRLRENNHIEPKEMTEFETDEFHLMAEVRASFKNCKRWVKRRLGLNRKNNATR